MKIKFIALLLLFNPLLALSVKESPVAGGVKIINFHSTYATPKVFFYDLPIYVKPLKKNYFQAIIGIPLGAKTGTHTITIKDSSLRRVTFSLQQHIYPEQRITLPKSKKKYINPNKKHIDRILKEQNILSKIRKTWSTQPNLEDFIMPVDGVQTGVFGSRRFFNNIAKNPHSGIDIANRLNTKIASSNTGEVILVGDFYFNGKTIFIDHGQGLLSVYIHLNQTFVKTGDKVRRGDIIGTMGKTGRTTGVNLHFGLYLNQVAVNPALFLTGVK